MALSFNLNLSSQANTTSRDNNGGVETAGSLASTNIETAGSVASLGGSGSLLADNSQIDQFVSSNPFAPQIDYSKYESVETAGSLASNGTETAGTLAFVETAGSVACAETAGSLACAETAGSVAFSGDSGGFSDSGSSFSSFG